MYIVLYVFSKTKSLMSYDLWMVIKNHIECLFEGIWWKCWIAIGIFDVFNFGLVFCCFLECFSQQNIMKLTMTATENMTKLMKMSPNDKIFVSSVLTSCNPSPNHFLKMVSCNPLSAAMIPKSFKLGVNGEFFGKSILL